MKRIGLLTLLILLTAISAFGQAWSGIIPPSRAMDWTNAGIAGGIPDASWTQCGSTLPAGSSVATINAALAACGTNQYVLLAPGTYLFNTSTSILFPTTGAGHIALRGSGATQTHFVFANMNQPSGCNIGGTAGIFVCGNQVNWFSSPTVHMWTAGFAQGATQITLDSVTGITVSTTNPTFLVLNQDDDGYTGYSPATGSAVDNGGYFVCADGYQAAGPTGCSYNGPDGTPPNPFTHRWQEEIVRVTNVSGNVVTIAEPLKHPNWRIGQVPTAIVWGPNLVQDGIENLSIDLQSDVGNTSNSYGIFFDGCYQCWVKGVEVKHFYNWGIGANYSTHLQIESNYFYFGGQTGSLAADPYAIRFFHTMDNLFDNNIQQHVRVSAFDGPDAGTVIGYNFYVNQYEPADSMFGAFFDHSAGDDYHLFEGNMANQLQIDGSHGTHLDETEFRNLQWGWESCANGQCGSSTSKGFGTEAVAYAAYNRYGNIIGNVVGTPGVTNTYSNNGFGSNFTAYYLGFGNPNAPPNFVAADPLTACSTSATLMCWGNWDSVTNAVRWCGNSSDTGWSTTCASTSEVSTAAPTYPTPVPTVGDTGIGQSALPASFYLSSRPPWYSSSIPFPAIGPDVTGGNVGQCTGTANTTGQFAKLAATANSQCTGTSLGAGWAGHVNAIPAMVCYFTQGGNPDGTSAELAFDPSCYGGGGGGANSTIIWNNLDQVIDGFGASDIFCINRSGYNACNLTDAQADLFFSPTAGAGLSLLRAGVPDDGSCSTTCTIPGTVTMNKAIARGAKVWATELSPPASMKSNGSVVCNPGSGVLNPGSYGAYATYLTNYVQQLQSTYSITLYALSMQNEPNYCPTYDGALWSAANFDTFIKTNLGPAFAGASLTTKIMFPETSGSSSLASWANTTMTDGSAVGYVGLVATHDYDVSEMASPVTYTTGGKNFWETEVSDFTAPDPSITSGLIYAKEIHDWLVNSNLNAWNWWWMVNNNADNEGLIQADGTVTKRLYTIGNFSRFVRPGYNRIDATPAPQTGVSVSAYRGPAGQLAIVAINQNGTNPVQTFTLNGVSIPTVTPYITDATRNLVALSPVTVVGGAFSYSLPAQSVITFVGNSGAAPSPPSKISIIVVGP